MAHQEQHPQQHDADDNEITEIEPAVERIVVKSKGTSTTPEPSSPSSSLDGERVHGTPELVSDGVVHQYVNLKAQEIPWVGLKQYTLAGLAGVGVGDGTSSDRYEEREKIKKGRFAYLKTKDFWIVLLLTQTIALAQTGTNTFTSLITNKQNAHGGTTFPAFQTFFSYVLLNIVYTSFTLYKYGFAKWRRMLVKDCWRYFILAFLDVEGNYFIVLAYDYTNLLSAQLFSFWTVIVVVAISLIFLKVRYHLAQYGGIVLACGGFAVLIASDYITKSNNYAPANALKGDLFCLLAQTLYGFSNTFEEFLVSKRPMYEVIGQLAFWGMMINGVQAGIFDRHSIATAYWDSQVIGYIIGYTLLLFIFYTLAPIVFRMSSAAFFNIGLLTGTFWGIVVGTQVLGYHIHYLYPIAFVLIILGHFVYYGTEGVLGEAKKPWLGENQELGENGFGTARRRAERPDAIV